MTMLAMVKMEVILHVQRAPFPYEVSPPTSLVDHFMQSCQLIDSLTENATCSWSEDEMYS
jgi:hypothetical protein